MSDVAVVRSRSRAARFAVLVVAVVAASCSHGRVAPAPRSAAAAPDPGATAQPRVPSQPPRSLGELLSTGDLVGFLLEMTDATLAEYQVEVRAAIDRCTRAQLERIEADAVGQTQVWVGQRLRLMADHAGHGVHAQERLPQPVALANRIAVLLPLSGRFGTVGQALRRAIELAPGAAVLSFVDTGGSAAEVEGAVDKAVALGAIAILGPVGEREAAVAAARASAVGIPIFLLSGGDGASPRDGIFRAVTSVADEARMAARLASDHGFPTVAALAPRDEVGTEMQEAFVAEAQRLGLAVTAVGTYDPTAQALEPDIKEFLGLDPAKNLRLRQHLRRNGTPGWQSFSPDIPFSLLYVPDRHDHGGLVAAYLPYLGVELASGGFADPEVLRRKHRGRIPQVVQLLGSSGWHHPALVGAGEPVEGAMVVDVFPGELDGADGAQFVEDYRRATGRLPSAMDAQVFDAATLLLAAMAEVPAADRGLERWRTMRLALAGARLDRGACGPARVGPDGEVERRFSLLQVQGGELVLAPW